MVNCPKCQKPCISYVKEMDFHVGNVVVPKQKTMFIKCEDCNVEVTLMALKVVDTRVVIRLGTEGIDDVNKDLGGNNGRS